jgi:hypothetical protein
MDKPIYLTFASIAHTSHIDSPDFSLDDVQRSRCSGLASSLQDQGIPFGATHPAASRSQPRGAAGLAPLEQKVVVSFESPHHHLGDGERRLVPCHSVVVLLLLWVPSLL